MEARGVEFVVVAVAGCRENIRLFMLFWGSYIIWGFVYRFNVNDEK